MSVCTECIKWERARESMYACVCVCVCKRGGDIFSVCIPGNCSAALLNNETSACIFVHLCVSARLCSHIGGGTRKKMMSGPG